MKLTDRGCKVLLSNSDTPYIRELYKDFSRHTQEVNALRSISTTKKVQLITFWVKRQYKLLLSRDEACEGRVKFLLFHLRFNMVKASGLISGVELLDIC